MTVKNVSTLKVGAAVTAAIVVLIAVATGAGAGIAFLAGASVGQGAIVGGVGAWMLSVIILIGLSGDDGGHGVG